MLIGCSAIFCGCSFNTETVSAPAGQMKTDSLLRKENIMKKSYYIDLMEKTLSAYSTEHVDRYFAKVKRDGLTEHGFPRLTANIGILIAHNRRTDLKERFIAMMDFCCQQIPRVIAANEFSVKEIIFCLEELEKSKVLSNDKLEEWKNQLRTIDPYKCYTKFARNPEDNVFNWAAFAMLSEFMRKKAGLTVESNDDFIEMQAHNQMRLLDSNNMYRDPGCPAVYDFVTRGLFAVLLHEGYQGQYRDAWQKALENCAEHSINMISVTGELPAGGRSQQFLHNESQVALMMEYYARLFAGKGDMITAGKYRSMAIRSLEHITSHLDKSPISHIKNRFPIESRYGCEHYAYFDKYMITAASFLYVAYRFCDDSIPPVERNDNSGMSWQTTDDFHMLYLRAGGYTAQYDYDAYVYYNGVKSYDCSGLARLHKKGAPSEICLSVSCPGKTSYHLDIENNSPLAIVPGVIENGKWVYAVERGVTHKVKSHKAEGNKVNAVVECVFPGGQAVNSRYTLSGEGLLVEVSGNDAVSCLLPVFRFNGETRTEVVQKGNMLTVGFNGFVCKFEVLKGTLKDLNRPARNRNGHYDSYAVEGSKSLAVKISIEKIQ